MNKSKRRVSKNKDEQEESDESVESLLLEEGVKKLLDIDIDGQRRRNIFINTEENPQRIRRSIIKRALRNVISSTPMITKTNGHFFSTECSLDISPINSENDEHSVREDNKKNDPPGKKIVHQPQNVERDVVSVSSSSSEINSESSGVVKYKDSQIKTHFTRSLSRKSCEKSPDKMKTDEEHTYFTRTKNRSKKNNKHIGMPELLNSSKNSSDVKSSDNVPRVSNMSKGLAHTKTVNEVEMELGENLSKSSGELSKSLRLIETVDKGKKKTAERISKSPYRIEIDKTQQSEKVSRLTSNVSKIPHLTEVGDETTNGIGLKSDKKIHKNIQNLSKSPGIKIIEKGNIESSPNVESENHSLSHDNFCEKLVGTKTFPYTLRNPEGLTTIQESEDIRTPTKTADCIRQSSVCLRNSRQNVTLRKSSLIENTQNFTFNKQSNTIYEEQPDIRNKNVENLQEKSSKIPVLRTRSKSREKPGKSESQTRLELSGKNRQLVHNSKKSEELLLNPPKPAPRRRKQKKSLVKSNQNISIPEIDENIQPKQQTSLQSSKTGDMLQKYFTCTNKNLSPIENFESTEHTDYSVRSAAKLFTERSTSPRKRSSVMLSCPKQKKSFDFLGNLGTGTTSSSFSYSSPSIDKEERCRRLDLLIDKLSEQKSPVDIGVGYSREVNTEPPLNLVSAKMTVTQHKEIQTSLWKSDKARRKAGAKKTCARNIFTKSIAETEPHRNTSQNISIVHNQTDINDEDSSLCSGKTDSSKMLDEYDGLNLFRSLEDEPICPETFSSFRNFDDPELMNERTPWRFEDQLLSQSSKRISVKLNFLRGANKIEEEKTLLSKEGIENFDHVNQNQKNILPRLRSTFRDYTHKSTRKNLLEPPKSCEEKTRNSFSDSSSAIGVCVEDIGGLENLIHHSRRISLEAEQEQNGAGEGCEPEENTLIGESNSQSSQIHCITKASNENAQGDNLTLLQKSKVMTPPRNTIDKDQIVVTKKSDVRAQKSNGLTQIAPDSTKKKNEIQENLQEIFSPSHSQKIVKSSERQLKNKPNDENENDKEKDEDCYYTPVKLTTNSSKNNLLRKDAKSICDMNQSKRKVSDVSTQKNCVQNRGSETDLNQLHLETSTNKRNKEDTSVETGTKVISYSGSKNLSFQIENNKKVDSREKFSENLSSVPDFATRNNNRSPVCQSEPSENVADEDTAKSIFGTDNEKKLCVMLRKFSKKTIDEKLHKIQRILDTEEEEDIELLSNKNSPIEKNHFGSFNDLAVPLGQTGISTIFSEGSDNVNEVSRPGSIKKNLKLKDKNAEEAVFKVPKTKSHKNRKRIFTCESDDTAVESEASSLTGTRRSGRDRRPPTKRYVMEFSDNLTTYKPPKKRVTRKTKLAKRKSVKSVEQQQGYITEVENNDQQETQTEEKETPRKEDLQEKRIRSRGSKKKVTSMSAHSSDEGGNESVKEVTNKRSKRNNKTKSDSIQLETIAQIHTMNPVSSFNEIDTASSHSPDDMNNFGNVEGYQNTDDMCLIISNQENMITQDSGTSTLLRSNSSEVSNSRTTKRQGKITKFKRKIKSNVDSQSVPVLQINEVNTPSIDAEKMSDSLIENECVDILSGSDVIKLKYIENDPKFRVCQDDLSLTNFMRNVSGASMGYLKLPPKGMKPVHTARKHSLCYFVVEGEGRIQVHNRTSTVSKMSHFFIPLGVEYAIMNDGTDDMLLACVRIVSP